MWMCQRFAKNQVQVRLGGEFYASIVIMAYIVFPSSCKIQNVDDCFSKTVHTNYSYRLLSFLDLRWLAQRLRNQVWLGHWLKIATFSKSTTATVNSWPTVFFHSFSNLSVDRRPTVSNMSVDHWWSVGNLSVDCRLKLKLILRDTLTFIRYNNS